MADHHPRVRRTTRPDVPSGLSINTLEDDGAVPLVASAGSAAVGREYDVEQLVGAGGFMDGSIMPSPLESSLPGSGLHGPVMENIFDFDWQGSFESLTAKVNAYEFQGELAGQTTTHPAPDFALPPSAPVQPGPAHSPGTSLTPGVEGSASAWVTAPVSASDDGAPAPVRAGMKRKVEADTEADDSTRVPSAPAVLPIAGSQRPSRSPAVASEGSSSKRNGPGSVESGVALEVPPSGPKKTSDVNSTQIQRSNARSSGFAASRTRDGDKPADPRSKTPLPIVPQIPHVLPHEKVFPIQIGSELYRLSGASISSDGQSFHGLPSSPAG